MPASHRRLPRCRLQRDLARSYQNRGVAWQANNQWERVKADGDRAVALLQEAIQKGFKDVEHLSKDPDLEPLRLHPGFKKLLTELQEQVHPGKG